MGRWINTCPGFSSSLATRIGGADSWGHSLSAWVRGLSQPAAAALPAGGEGHGGGSDPGLRAAPAGEEEVLSLHTLGWD